MSRPYTKFRFLIVSGPTREPLDPVRFLSNYSTGVMGKHLNDAAKRRGHAVTWVRCPEDAETAKDLLKKLVSLTPKHDALLMAAAVADARPAVYSTQKIKKDGLQAIRLVKNPDVLAALAKKKKKGQVFVGFALETRDLFENAFAKLEKKGLDAVVLQQVTHEERPFGDRKIGAYILDARGGSTGFEAVEKSRLAGVLIEKTERLLASKRGVTAK